jgi:hypothetical protein
MPSLHLAQGLALFASVFSLSVAQAQEALIPFFETPSQQTRQTADPLPAGYQAVALDAVRLGALPSGTRTAFSGPGLVADYQIQIEQVKTSAQGSRTIVGHLADHDEQYRVIITQSGNAAFGRITTPEGVVYLEPRDGGLVLVNPAQAGLQVGPQGQCGLPPPQSPLNVPVVPAPQSSIKGNIDLPPAEAMLGYRSGNSVVDILLVYTPDFVSRYGGQAAAMARLDHLVALSNQAYADSGVAITLRDVHRTQVSYGTASSNSATLDAITANSGVFSGIPGLRSQYGADFVALVRPFEKNSQGSCGVAWSGGYMGQAFTQTYAYSVSSDGSDISGSRYYCDDVTFPHEVGHNMGLAHNWGQGGAGQGRYSYGNGYGVPQSFGTVMSYISPSIARFSNPNQTCNGVPCGIPEGQAQPADASRALNNVRGEVASITPTATSTTPNQLPVVSAGSDQVVQGGNTVQLSGSASDPDGSIVSVQWQQTYSSTGSLVSLSGANTLSPSFTAPSQTVDLSFRLTATDNLGASSSSTVTVRVTATPTPTNPLTQRECFFGWAERSYPQFFGTTSAATQQNGLFFSRYYSAYNAYLWIFTQNGQNSRLYYFGPASGFGFLDLGAFGDWALQAGC